MPDWTPGPWETQTTTSGRIHQVYQVNGNLICELRTSAADARLIAAAPDLLAALKTVVAIADRKTVEFARAHAAIAKAEGRS